MRCLGQPDCVGFNLRNDPEGFDDDILFYTNMSCILGNTVPDGYWSLFLDFNRMNTVRTTVRPTSSPGYPDAGLGCNHTFKCRTTPNKLWGSIRRDHNDSGIECVAYSNQAKGCLWYDTLRECEADTAKWKSNLLQGWVLDCAGKDYILAYDDDRQDPTTWCYQEQAFGDCLPSEIPNPANDPNPVTVLVKSSATFASQLTTAQQKAVGQAYCFHLQDTINILKQSATLNCFMREVAADASQASSGGAMYNISAAITLPTEVLETFKNNGQEQPLKDAVAAFASDPNVVSKNHGQPANIINLPPMLVDAACEETFRCRSGSSEGFGGLRRNPYDTAFECAANSSLATCTWFKTMEDCVASWSTLTKYINRGWITDCDDKQIHIAGDSRAAPTSWCYQQNHADDCLSGLTDTEPPINAKPQANAAQSLTALQQPRNLRQSLSTAMFLALSLIFIVN